MKKVAVLLLLCILFLNSCTALPQNAGTESKENPETQAVTTKDPEVSADPAVTTVAEADSSGDEGQDEPLAPEPQAKSVLVCSTLTSPLIMLPYHDADNLPADFILAMQNNPIDRDYWKIFEDPRISSIAIAGEYGRQYKAIWKEEIDQTIDQLVALWGENYRSAFETYAVLSLEQINSLSIESYLFYYNEEINYGRWMLALEGLEQSIDAHRNTAFMLKYYLYLIECHNNGKAENSLRFSFETEAVDENNVEYIVVPRDTCVVDMTLSPAYSHDSGDGFSEKIQEILAQEHNEAFWRDALIAETKNLYSICQRDIIIRYYGDYFAYCAQQWEIEDELADRRCITVSKEQKSSRSWVAARQLAIKLQYWQYLLDTEPRLPEF